MSFAKSLIETHMASDQSVVEFEITQENTSEIMPLFREFKQLNLSPVLEERSSGTYLVVDISSYKKKMRNVVSLNISKHKKAEVIEIDFINKKRK